MSEPEVFPCPMCGHEVRVVGGRTTQHYEPVERSAGAAPIDVHVLGTAYWSHRLRAGSSHDEPIRDICNDRCMPDIAATYARLLAFVEAEWRDAVIAATYAADREATE